MPKEKKKEIERLEIVLPEDDANRETKILICNYLMDGMWKQDAANLAGISKATLFRWMDEDATFKTWVEASVLYYKRLLIKDISFGYKTGQPLEVLKTRWPQQWNIAKKVAVVDPAEELKRTLAILEGEDFVEGEVEEDDSESIDGEVEEDPSPVQTGDTPKPQS